MFLNLSLYSVFLMFRLISLEGKIAEVKYSSGRSSGEGNGNPLLCSCLESPRDGGAWRAAVYGVTQSRTRLKRLSSNKGIWGQEERGTTEAEMAGWHH